MPYIKAQKVKRDSEGRVVSGSAAIIDARYVPGEGHHVVRTVRERLGKVVQLSEDGRSGVFRSPTRGLVRYDADADEIEPVERGDGTIADESYEFPEPQAHVVAGAVLLLLHILEKRGVLAVLRAAFPAEAEYERCLAHLLHSVLSSAKVVGCDDFFSTTAASHLLPKVSAPSLRSDSAYFHAMGSDDAKVSFFKALVSEMRSRDEGFGTCCYVDSTPLPNDARNNPFNALCSHGTDGTKLQARLGLVLDSGRGVPTWYELVPGNLPDHSTLESLREDVSATLGVTVDSATLDAGYVTRELVTGKMRYLARMPAKRGYPTRKSLYAKVKQQLNRGKHALVHNGHTYFGRRFEQEVFGTESRLYVYVDKDNALSHLHQVLTEDPDAYEALLVRDKDWEGVRGGFFVLISNREPMTPKEALDEYFCRLDIESFFKTSKDCLDLLPLAKWTETAVRGKILHDVICTVALLEVRRAIAEAGKSWAPKALFGKASSVMCVRSGGSLVLETPNRQAREWSEALGYKFPTRVDVESYRKDVLGIGK